MDSVSHIRVAHLLLDYVQRTCGISLDESGFVYGSLKPDLTGTYLTKRHYPSLMMDDVFEKIRIFTETYVMGLTNSRDLSIDLGEICHFITDFFTFPHNDDIYDRSLFAHYLYEKRIALVIRRRMTASKFECWASPILAPATLDGLLDTITSMHDKYRTQSKQHCINDDLEHICKVTVMVVLSIINLTYEQIPAAFPALA